MPVTICTVADGYAVYQQPQRKTFYANGLFWEFYSDGTNMVYRTSADGITWSAATTVRACVNGRMFSIRHYNLGGVDYVYYAYATEAYNAAIVFCRGSISGSTISWGTEYTVLAASATWRYGFPDVDFGSVGNAAYVGFSRGASGSTLYWMVYKNTQNNGSGTWVLSYYEALSLTAGGTAFADGALTRLTNDRIYTAFTSTVTIWLGGSLWTGSVWSPASASHETIVNEQIQEVFGLGSYGDDVYVAYRKSADNYVYFNLRTYDVGWGTEETVEAAGSIGVHLCVDQSNGDCYAWWGRIGILWYAKRTTTWASPVNFSAEAEIFTVSVTPFWIVTNNAVGIVWTRGFITTYLRFGILSIVPVVVKKPIMKIDKGPHPRSRLQFKPTLKNVFGFTTRSQIESACKA